MAVILGLSDDIKPGPDTLNNIVIIGIVKEINAISFKMFGERIIKKNKVIDKYKKLILKDLLG